MNSLQKFNDYINNHFSFSDLIEIKSAGIVNDEYYSISIYSDSSKSYLIYHQAFIHKNQLNKLLNDMNKHNYIFDLLYKNSFDKWPEVFDIFIKYTGDSFVIIIHPDNDRQINVFISKDDLQYNVNLEQIREFYTNTIKDTKVSHNNFDMMASIYKASEHKHRVLFNLKLQTEIKCNGMESIYQNILKFIDASNKVNVKAF